MVVAFARETLEMMQHNRRVFFIASLVVELSQDAATGCCRKVNTFFRARQEAFYAVAEQHRLKTD